MLEISHSEMKAFARCPRQWFITWVMGMVPANEPVTGNRQLGTRIHTALEAHYGYKLDPIAVLEIIYSLLLRDYPDDTVEIRAEWEMANIMVRGYLEWADAEGADADLEVIATEAQVKVPLPGVDGVMLRARLDQALMVKSSGELCFLDHKTAAGFERHELMELDTQIPTYCLVQHLAVQHLPEPRPLVVGGYVNTLRRVKRTERSKPPYYRRDFFPVTDARLNATYHRTVKLCQQIKTAREQIDWVFAQGLPPNLDMINRYQLSELRPVPILTDCSWSCPLAGGQCAMMDDGSNWLEALFRGGHWQQVDPYAYYSDNALSEIRAELSP